MISAKHLLKVSLVWVNIVYVICFLVVVIYPPLREQFMLYALHTNVELGQDVTTVTTFITGLIWWNILAVSAVGLFAWLDHKIKK